MNGKALAGTLYRCEACGHIGGECLEVPEYATAHGPGGSYVGTCVGVERYCVKCGGDVDIVLEGSVMPKRVCCYCGCALDDQLTTDAREVSHGACEQCIKDVLDERR